MKSSLRALAVSVFAALSFAFSTLSADPLFWSGATPDNTNWAAEVWGTSAEGPFTNPWVNNSVVNMTFGDGNRTILVSNPVNAPQFNFTAAGGNRIVTLNATGGDLVDRTLNMPAIDFPSSAFGSTLRFRGSFESIAPFTVTGRGTVHFGLDPLTVTNPINGTITVHADRALGGNTMLLLGTNGSGVTSANTHISLIGLNGANQAMLQMAPGEFTIGSLTSNSGLTQVIRTGTGAATLNINQSIDTTFAGLMFATQPTTIVKDGSGKLRLTAGNNIVGNTSANNMTWTAAGGVLEIGGAGNYQAASSYVTVNVNNGAVLASDATGRTLRGNSHNVTNGAFTDGVNTNGFRVFPQGPSAVIDPTGAFFITELVANAGARLKIDGADDILNLFTLTGADNAGSFVIDLSGFASIATGTPYSVLSWQSASGVSLTDFGAILPEGLILDGSFGTGGFSYVGSLTEPGVLQVQVVVPEPSVYTALVGLLALACVLLRRRRIQD